MRNLQRWIAERLFEAQLDEDFNMGVKHGRNLAIADARFKIETAKQASYKKNQPGINLAIETLK